MSLLSYLYGYRAYLAHSNGDLKKAEELYEKAFRGGCGSVKFMGTYGVLLMRLGKFEESLKYFDRALKANDVKNELRDMIRLNRAMVYLKTGKADRALVALEDLHQKKPGSRIYHSLGYAYILAGKLDKALAYNKEALEYDNEDFVVLDNMGQTYYELGDIPNAKLYFEKAYEQKQEQIDILYHLGLVREAEGDLAEALKFYRQALLYRPDALNDVTRPQLFACEKRVMDRIVAEGGTVPEPEVEIKRDDQPADL